MGADVTYVTKNSAVLGISKETECFKLGQLADWYSGAQEEKRGW